MSDPKQEGGGSRGAPAHGREPTSAEGEDAATPAAPAAAPARADEYKVGPGRPPRDTRFKKGISGNPSGRRKEREGFWDILRDVAYGRVRVKDHGELSRIEVVLMQLFADAIKGEKRARAECIELMIRYSPPPKATNENDEASAGEDREVIKAFIESLRRKNPPRGEGDTDE